MEGWAPVPLHFRLLPALDTLLQSLFIAQHVRGQQEAARAARGAPGPELALPMLAGLAAVSTEAEEEGESGPVCFPVPMGAAKLNYGDEEPSEARRAWEARASGSLGS